MIHPEYFKDKKVTVVGLARSGVACAHLLLELGAVVSVTDSKDDDATRRAVSFFKPQAIKVELGGHTKAMIEGRDLVVLSPGVPDTALPVAWARESGIPVMSEIEFAYRLCPATIIAVTGSNGKTTVTTLIGKVLAESGRKVFVCGNIGNPFSKDVALMRKGDFVALEISSFQLETIQSFKPYISVILNFSRNHLDRYQDMGEYLNAKKRIFMNQDASDYLVLNSQDMAVSGLAAEAKAKAVYFKESPEFNPNQAAVVSVASILGIEKQVAVKVFKEFSGVEHRMEHVAEIHGIEFVNDSKATTVDATAWALRQSTKPLVLIAGGREKGNDYSLIAELVGKKVKAVVVIGEAKHKIRDVFERIVPVEEAANLPEAIDASFKKAKTGDCVLFSPMCKSFDMFTDYEDRGRRFKQAVLEAAKGNR